jgi:hypothetical protein
MHVYYFARRWGLGAYAAKHMPVIDTVVLRKENLMQKVEKLIVAGIVLVLALALVFPTALAETASVAGAWTLTIDTPSGTFTPSAVFKQDGDKLTGTYKAEQIGEVPLTGTIKDNKIQFSFKITPQGQELVVTFSGTVEGNTMKGDVKFGEMGGAPFTGKREESSNK